MRRMPPPRYYALPDGSGVAIIPKSGSTAIAKALLAEVHQEHLRPTVGADAANSPGWQMMVPKIAEPEVVILPVRDPLERFRSACAQVRVTDVDAVLDELEGGVVPDPHFRPASDYQRGRVEVFRFPEELDGLALRIGVDSIPKVNDGAANNPPKPVLTAAQEERVRKIYHEDFGL